MNSKRVKRLATVSMILTYIFGIKNTNAALKNDYICKQTNEICDNHIKDMRKNNNKIKKFDIKNLIKFALPTLVLAPLVYKVYDIAIDEFEMPRQMKKEYDRQIREFNAVKSNDIELQKGINWCWLACYQELFKLKGVKIKQEDLYKKLFDKNPWFFKSLRKQGGGPDIILSRDFISKMNNIDKKLKFKAGTIYWDKDLNVDEKLTGIKYFILNFYDKIGKKAFCISDSLAWSDNNLGHAVNIVKIFDSGNIVTIDDPWTGLSRNENLDTFVKRYWENNGAKRELHGINFTTLIEENIKYDWPDSSYVKINKEDNNNININIYELVKVTKLNEPDIYDFVCVE